MFHQGQLQYQSSDISDQCFIITWTHNFKNMTRTFLNQSIHTYPMCLSELFVLHSRVIADISSRYILCWSILYPKCIFQFHQFYTFTVKQICHSVPNSIYVVLFKVARTFCWSRFSTRSFPTFHTCDSQTLLTTTLQSDLLWYGYFIVIPATLWTLLAVSTKINLTRSGHDVLGWVMKKNENIDAEGLSDADSKQIWWYIKVEVSVDADFEQISWNINTGVLGNAVSRQIL